MFTKEITSNIPAHRAGVFPHSVTQAGAAKFIRIHFLFHTSLWLFAAAAAKSLQSCPTVCDPTDGSLTGSPVPGILQARTLEWVAIAFSNR